MKTFLFDKHVSITIYDGVLLFNDKLLHQNNALYTIYRSFDDLS